MDIYADFQSIGVNGYHGVKEKPSLSKEQLYRMLYTQKLSELSANRFEWHGLPGEIDVRFMELTIMRHGLSVFYYEPMYEKFFAAQGTPSGMSNMMDEPISYMLGYSRAYEGRRQLSKAECVPVWGNYLRQPEMLVIAIYAQKLAEIETTIDVNTKQARRPRVLVGNKNQRRTLVSINNQIDEGVAAIGVNSGFDMSQISSFDLGIDPKTLDDLYIARGRAWNVCMGLLGINHANQDKKERLVADEVAANDEQVTAMKAVALNARERAADEINAMFNGTHPSSLYAGEPLNVSVSFKSDPTSADRAFQEITGAFNSSQDENNEDEGDDNGTV